MKSAEPTAGDDPGPHDAPEDVPRPRWGEYLCTFTTQHKDQRATLSVEGGTRLLPSLSGALKRVEVDDDAAEVLIVLTDEARHDICTRVEKVDVLREKHADERIVALEIESLTGERAALRLAAADEAG
jgi:hypothetical protein